MEKLNAATQPESLESKRHDASNGRYADVSLRDLVKDGFKPKKGPAPKPDLIDQFYALPNVPDPRRTAKAGQLPKGWELPNRADIDNGNGPLDQYRMPQLPRWIDEATLERNLVHENILRSVMGVSGAFKVCEPDAQNKIMFGDQVIGQRGAEDSTVEASAAGDHTAQDSTGENAVDEKLTAEDQRWRTGW